MQFALRNDHTYWWPVNVIMPDPERAGMRMTQSFEMQFRPLGWDESYALAKQVADLPAEQQAEHQHDELLKVCTGWRGVVDEKGEEVPFSPEVLKRALQQGWFATGVRKSYIGSLTLSAS